MTWFNGGRWAAFDTETTAPDPTEARLVTACVAFVGGGQPTEVMSWVVDAGVDVPAEAAAIHGYTTERVRAEGKPLADVLPEIVGYLVTAVAAGLPLVAFNACYDNTVLDRETRRAGMTPFADDLDGAIVLDPFVLDKKVDRYRPGRRTLETCCQVYDVRLDAAHDSTFDALAAGRVLYRIGQRTQMRPDEIRSLYADRRYPDEFPRAFRALGAMSLDELHAAQVGWYAEQAEGLGRYWAQCAEEKRIQARDADPGSEARQIAEQEAAELDAKVDGLRFEWPVQPVSEEVPA